MELPAPALVTLLLWLGRIVKAEIRCHCNDASCVATGYMCKSELGRCFTLISFDGEHSQSTHGCVDFLPHPDRTYCEGQGDVLQTRGGIQGWPVLMCCQADMCNYMRDVDLSFDVDTKINRTSGFSDHHEDQNYRWEDLDERVSQGELWFKAAVIAVPIAGGFILILLVLLAIRMLRSDTKRHKRLMELRKHRSLTKAQLYVADHFIEKAEPTAHTNALGKPNHLYKNVNIQIDYDGALFDKQIDTKNTAQPGSCDSVIVWGDEKRKTSVSSAV